MNNRCPKCGKKLSFFYMKQNCPKCNVNLVYYNLDKNLESDHEKAMKEQAAVDKFLNNLKISTVGTKTSLIRFITFFSPLVWMLLPMFETRNNTVISLLSVITGIINDSMPVDLIFSDRSYLFPVLCLACIIIFSLAVIISACFSTGKNALLRNVVFSIINTLVFIVLVAASVISGATVDVGVFIVFAVYVLEIVLHKSADKIIH